MSSDLPSTFAQQQEHAKAHSGESLEVLGKHAAAGWGDGRYSTLTEAVTSIVKEAQLSPEQVKRVVEFANTAAFLQEFRKEGAAHHVVEFPGGPANVSDILKDLNSGGGGTVFDRGTLDYNDAPHSSTTKTSSDEVEEAFLEMFGVKEAEAEEPFANPYGPIIDLHDKLAGAADQLLSDVSEFEIAYAELGDRVYHQVKQASLEGVPLGQIMQAWETVAPAEEYVKVAFMLMTPRLLREGVFHEADQMISSIDKVASQGSTVNPEHPLVTEFGDFCVVLQKLAELRELRNDVVKNRNGLAGILKQADGVAGKVWDAATSHAATAGKAVSKHVGGTAGAIAGKAVEYAPHAATALAANEAYQHYKNSPSMPARIARGGVNVVARQIPGTQAQQEHEWRIQNGQ